ncbi:MAG: hypothetical protein DVB27_09405 [Verrucomicrobia bacterium]|nr:MAG: hypothetical protein DVB27_09405 [Verrucomicrobiota bacterium]
MKRPSTTKTLLAGAALAGILSGGLVAQAAAATATQSGKTVSLAGVLADATKPDPDHGCAGKNTCKGKGGCKSGDNGCGGKNSCKGKGGCAIKDGKPVHPVK